MKCMLMSPRSLLLLAAFASLPLTASAQENKTKVEAKPALKVEAVKPEAKTKATTTKRLPAYFEDVVSEEQKTKIYDLNAKHAPDIDKLEEQLKAAVAKRDAEIEALLTAEQKTKIAKLKEEAAAKKKETAAAKKPATPATPAANAKPATAAK